MLERKRGIERKVKRQEESNENKYNEGWKDDILNLHITVYINTHNIHNRQNKKNKQQRHIKIYCGIAQSYII